MGCGGIELHSIFHMVHLSRCSGNRRPSRGDLLFGIDCDDSRVSRLLSECVEYVLNRFTPATGFGCSRCIAGLDGTEFKGSPLNCFREKRNPCTKEHQSVPQSRNPESKRLVQERGLQPVQGTESSRPEVPPFDLNAVASDRGS